jgi:hypothetical protein
MQEEKEAAPKKGWLKAILGTLGGLLSGAFVMYATAAFNQVVKPAKPLANFKYDFAGNTVRFQNLSGSSQGWWDFGDGTPLEPVADRDTVFHKYARPGDYTVKLTVQNILGDQSDRSVTVHLDASGADPSAAAPQAAALEAESVSPGAYAPATFKVVGKVQNAQLCLLDYGDERPPEIVNGTAAERLVTFKQPGGHAIKLIAINGTRVDTKTEIVNVEEAPSGTISAVLTISDTATRVTSGTRWLALYPGRSETASPDSLITGVSVKEPGGQWLAMAPRATELELDPAALGMTTTRDLKLEIVNGGKAVQLSGESQTNWRGQPYAPEEVRLKLTEVKRQSVGQDGVTVSTTLAMPGGNQSSVAGVPLPGVPADWQDVKRLAKLRLADGDKTLWEGQVPASATFAVGKRSFFLTVTADGAKGQLHLDLRDTAAVAPAAN